jgi:aspartyl protease family protein
MGGGGNLFSFILKIYKHVYIQRYIFNGIKSTDATRDPKIIYLTIKPKSHKSATCSFTLIGLLLLSNFSLAVAQNNSSFRLPPVMADVPALPPPIDKPISFISYDGSNWADGKNQTKDLHEAASNPVNKTLPAQMKNGDFVVHVSPDGHYYIPGGVNGFPVRFMVDSGAVYSSIPLRLARNVGIRVGISKPVNTANGLVNVGETSGNIITLGTLGFTNVHVLVISGLETALLGAEVLNTLDISYAAGVMTIKAIDKVKSNTLSKD